MSSSRSVCRPWRTVWAPGIAPRRSAIAAGVDPVADARPGAVAGKPRSRLSAMAGGPSADDLYEHTYASTGTFKVTLYVVDRSGGMSSVQQIVSVS